MGTPCVFLDRDGIANQYPGPGQYVETLADFHLLPEFLDVLRTARERGYAVVVVTNQRGVALGRMRRETLDAIHEHLRQIVREGGLDLLDILVCTDEHDEAPRRKPNPGMLLEAAAKHGLDLPRSWMIGDSRKDVEAGRRAGCRTVLVGTRETAEADDSAADMQELVRLLARSLPDVRGRV